MTVRALLDTNILLYALGLPTGSAGDVRAETANRLLDKGGLVSVQILNEFTDVASRKLRFPWPRIQELLSLIEAFCGPALSLTAESQRNAVLIAARWGYRIYDATILASAFEAGCGVLYTEDMQHGQIIEGVRIVNPFLP
jgi:predicted nucleic acid-binding protein